MLIHISNAFISPPTEPAANASAADTNDTADNHYTNIINDKLKKVGHFYRLQCFGKGGGGKRRASSSVDLDDKINCHHAAVEFY